jgi:hypothetical protein
VEEKQGGEALMMTIDGGPKAAAAAAAHISPLFPLSRVSSIRAAPAICAPMASNVLARSQCGPGLVDQGRLAARTRPRMMISLARVSFFPLFLFAHPSFDQSTSK